MAELVGLIDLILNVSVEKMENRRRRENEQVNMIKTQK